GFDVLLELVTAPPELVVELDEQLDWDPPELLDDVVPTPPAVLETPPLGATDPGPATTTVAGPRLLPTLIPPELLGPEAPACEEPLGPEVVAALELEEQLPEVPLTPV